MVTIGMDLVARAKKLHDVESLQHENGQALGELRTRQPAPIRIRTVCGSDSTHLAKPCDSRTTIGRSLKTVHREFDGTLAEFRLQIEKAMGGQQGSSPATQVWQKSLVWQQPGDTGRIEMKACNRRVYITGTDHQLRSLCIVLAPFVLEHPARSDATGSLDRTVRTQNKVRMANHAFAAEHSDELELSEGDLVSIIDDPEQKQASVCRWVCGINTTTQKCGWFPLNYTSSAMGEA